MTDSQRAVFKIHINGSIDAVWREITKTDELNEVFFNMRMDVDEFKPGGKLRMRTAGDKYTGAVGEILEFNPPHRFSHTFRFTQYDDPPCTMIYELKEVTGGVEFTLTADNIPVGTKSGKQLSSGGNMIVNTLKNVVEKGRPSLGIRMLYVLFKLLTPMTPKKCLSKNWP